MECAIVYSCLYAKTLNREGLIYENAEMALAHAAIVERHFVARKDVPLRNSPLGLTDIVAPDPVIAMGMQPHIALADFQKRSLLAGDLGPYDDAPYFQDIEQLIWSCANTSRAVAVGDDAWHALQLLPVADRRHYAVPPLKLLSSQAEMTSQRIFIINHEADDRLARDLAELAASEGFTVACSGLPQNSQHRRLPVTHSFCCERAVIHVHVGHHSDSAKTFRLTDSWHSGRLAVQLLLPSPSEGRGAGNLMIEDEVNGFICHSASAVLAACREMQQDHVLSRKLVSAGHHSAEPLARAWFSIAQDLLV